MSTRGLRMTGLGILLMGLAAWASPEVPGRSAVQAGAPRCEFITDEITINPGPPIGTVFFETELSVEAIAGAKFLLSRTCDGTGNVHVDDQLEVTVESDEARSFTHDYSAGCSGQILPAGPHDISSLFRAGANKFTVRMRERCGGVSYSSPLYLVTKEPVCDSRAVQVGNALAEGCFTERTGAQVGVFETDLPAWVGGFDLRPRAGGKLVVDTARTGLATVRAEGAGVDWTIGSLTVSAPLSELRTSRPSFTVGVNQAGTFERLLSLPLLRAASAEAKVTWASGGAGAKVELSVSIEELTRNLGKAYADNADFAVGTLAGKVTFALANLQPFQITDGELELPSFAVNDISEFTGPGPDVRIAMIKNKVGFGGGKFKAQTIEGKVTWSGEVSFLFPWDHGSQGKLTGRLLFVDGQAGGMGLDAEGFRIPLGDSGWDWTGVQGNIVLGSPFGVDVGMTAQRLEVPGQPRLLNWKAKGNLRAFSLARVACPNGAEPLNLAVEATIPKLEDLGYGAAKFTLAMCAYLKDARSFSFEVGGTADIVLGLPDYPKLFAARGSLKGWFHGFDFNLDGSVDIDFPLFPRLTGLAVFSSEGYAACGVVGFVALGFATTNWLEAPEAITACDFSPYRAVPTRGLANTDAVRDVNVTGTEPAIAIAVEGEGGAPRVRVTGPNGEVFTTPAGDEALQSRDAIIMPVDEFVTTYVFLRRPAGGTWKVEAQPGSVPIANLETARQLPKPSVTGSVRLDGGSAVLSWDAAAAPGQKIEFFDRSSGAIVPLHTTTKPSGSVTFTPGNLLARRHTVEAVVTRSGIPQGRFLVATYDVKAPPLLGRVTPTAIRKPGRVIVSWNRLDGAGGYIVTAFRGKQVLARVFTTHASLALRRAPRKNLRFEIVAQDSYGRLGKRAVLRVP